MAKALIFGAKGYLGQHFLEASGGVASDVDIADPVAVAKALDVHKPDVVINCAGKTGRPNVDWCEDHKEETLRANVTGPLVLLEECGKRDLYWVQLGSGCIYAGDNGGKGFSEEDEPNYTGSFYSRTKLWCDQMIKDVTESPSAKAKVLLLRPRMPFDGTTHERNLISKIRKYKKLIDEPNSLTYLPDLLDVAQKLIAKRATGLYNVVNPGAVSAFWIMTQYKKTVDPTHQFEKFSLEDLQKVTKAGRSNCLLSIEKLKKEGIVLPSVEDRLNEAMEALKSAA
jgi:dTDP-4-dehydrorhamnose reductase